MKQEKQKGFILPIIGILLVILVVGAGAYYSGTIKNNKTEQAQPVVTNQTTPSPQNINQTPTKVTQNETASWQKYTNTKYDYSLQYPNNLPAYNGSATSKKEETADMDTTDSVSFGCSGFGVGVCLPPFTVGKSTLKDTQLNEIYNLKVGDQVSQNLTYTLGGQWNQKTNYIRLTDQVVNDTNLLVLDNPSGYGGSNRLWFVKKNGTTLQFNCIYTNQTFLTTCQTIISTINLN